jgi:hypothetical protein
LTSYDVSVSSHTSAGKSAEAAPISVTTFATPETPTGLMISSMTDTTITVEWDITEDYTYKVYHKLSNT